jgi:predicted transcriptional regulator
MDNIDLNIDNYNLQELLSLFSISENFSEKDMKEAKKIVLKTHPDKSGLDPKYFLFFSKAFKIIYGIFEFRETNKKDHSKYKTLDNPENDEIIKNALASNTVKKDFNKWFNELFEKSKIEDEYNNSGYENWLRSDEDLENFSNLNKEQQEIKLEEKRNKIKTLSKFNEIKDIQGGGYDLLRQKPEDYSSDIFSSLAFEDLKKAHQESIIPITNQDINNIEQRSMSQLKIQRDEKITIPTMEQSKQLLSDNNSKDNRNNAERAFRLLREDELIREKNKEALRSMRRLR